LNATVSCSSINLGWTNPTLNAGVQWGPAGFALGSGNFAAATTNYAINTLHPITAYDLYVAAVCSNGDT